MSVVAHSVGYVLDPDCGQCPHDAPHCALCGIPPGGTAPNPRSHGLSSPYAVPPTGAGALDGYGAYTGPPYGPPHGPPGPNQPPHPGGYVQSEPAGPQPTDVAIDTTDQLIQTRGDLQAMQEKVNDMNAVMLETRKSLVGLKNEIERQSIQRNKAYDELTTTFTQALQANTGGE